MNIYLKKLMNLKNYFPEIILFFILVFFSYSIINYEKHFSDYVYVENLINYEGGFVRRGFLGSIAIFFYETLNINPKFFFTIVYSFLYIFLILIFVYLINSLKKENFYLSILLIISPATLLFVIFDYQALFRKEIFFILIIFIHSIIAHQVFEKKLSYKSYLNFNLFLILPTLFFNILIHEFQFFLLIFHYLINLSVLKFLKKKDIYFKYSYLFLMVVFILTITSGNENTVETIESSLETLVPNIKNDYGPTNMLDGNLNLLIGSFLKMIISSSFSQFFQVFLMLLFSVLLFLFVFNKILELRKLNLNYFNSSNCFLFLYIFLILIIFIFLAFDYGRLFHILTMHTVAFYLILPFKTFRFNHKSFSKKFTTNLVLIFYFLFFSMPHAHVLMGKGSMYLDNGNGILNYIIQNFDPFIQRILL